MSSEAKETSIKPKDTSENRTRRTPNKPKENNLGVKICPFQAFRICDNSCKYYICYGRPDVIKERISKGYASEYLKSVLF